LVFLFALFSSPSYQWGEEGHKIIAEIAANMLTTDATSAVSAFLGDNTLPYVAPMPDDYCHTPQGAWSAPCHFVNMPRDATQFEWSDCPDCCVVKAINNYTQILITEDSNPSFCESINDDTIEPCALIFVVHYIGDVHQPLHVGYADDKGGNEVTVSYFGTTTNLHEVWDTKIIEMWDSDYYDAYQDLQGMINDNPDWIAQYTKTMNPVDWADESFDFVRSTCYNFTTTDGVGQIDQTYYNTNLPIIQQRLIAAGIRLGTQLNTALPEEQKNLAKVLLRKHFR